MIKEVETIPSPAKAKQVTRAGTIKEDVQTALNLRINKFEFVGDIYTTCDGRYVSGLKKGHVDDCAYYPMRCYIRNIARENGIDVDPGDVRRFYKVYSCPTKDGDRVFMEIYFEMIFRYISDATNTLSEKRGNK